MTKRIVKITLEELALHESNENEGWAADVDIAMEWNEADPSIGEFQGHWSIEDFHVTRYIKIDVTNDNEAQLTADYLQITRPEIKLAIDRDVSAYVHNNDYFLSDLASEEEAQADEAAHDDYWDMKRDEARGC